jgi:hypothetical protein
LQSRHRFFRSGILSLVVWPWISWINLQCYWQSDGWLEPNPDNICLPKEVLILVDNGEKGFNFPE